MPYRPLLLSSEKSEFPREIKEFDDLQLLEEFLNDMGYKLLSKKRSEMSFSNQDNYVTDSDGNVIAPIAEILEKDGMLVTGRKYGLFLENVPDE